LKRFLEGGPVMSDIIEWSSIKKRREEVKNLYPSIFRVPVIYGKKKQIINDILSRTTGKVLDLGAGDRFVETVCRDMHGIDYRSMDPDRSGFHDYYSTGDIAERFDMVLLLDVIEHLTLDKGAELLHKCGPLMNPGGTLVVTIPNNNHPTAYAGDCTHITSYRYHEIGALLLLCGFKDIKIFRVSAREKFKDRLLSFLFRRVMKFMDVDFATGILVTAKKP